MAKTFGYCSHLVVQTLLAIVFMWLVLFSLDQVATSRIMWAVGASTLASSAFIIFCVPQNTVATPWKVLCAYLLAIVVGEVMRMLMGGICHSVLHCVANQDPLHLFEILGALTVGMMLLLMIVLRVEHPPAAGLAVVMVLDIRNLPVLGVIFGAAVVLVLIRLLFRKSLCNLVL